MSTTKLSISFEKELEQAIRSAAAAGDQSVSSWIAEAAQRKLQFERLGEAVRAWEAENGALTADELEQASRTFDKADKTRRSSKSNVA
jgi:hypothetical protein